MADSDKNILITPNKSGVNKPNIVLTGKGVIPITLNVNNDTDGTLTFEGSSGVLFSLDNNLSYGKIFSINDASAVPLFDVDADGTVRLNPYGTTIYVGGISGDAVVIRPATRPSTGAGANITIAAGSGVTTGGGGSVILQPGAQAAGGGNGKVIVRGLSGSTANLQEWQNSAGTALAYVSYTGDSWFNGIRVGTGPGTTTYNTTIGSGAFNSNTSGTHTTAIGYNALNANTSGAINTAVGAFALQANTTGVYNTAIGYGALGSATTQSNNTAIGRAAISSSTGSGNTAVGSTIAQALTTGNSNVLVGNSTAQALTTGSLNIAIGANCLTYTTTADGNISIGHESARLQADGTTALTASNNNIYIGTYVKGLNNSDTNSIVIGCYAVGKGANTTVIGTTSTTTSYLYGETQYIGGVAGTAISLQPQARSTTGAGANVTIAAGAGVTTGAGGSIILQPGAQATTGGDGAVQIKGTGASTTLKLTESAYNRSFTFSMDYYAGSLSASGGLVGIDLFSKMFLSTSGYLRASYSNYVGLGQSNGQYADNWGFIYLRNDGVINWWGDVGLTYGSVGQIRVSNASTGGGSFAFTSSSPGGYTGDQTDLVLNGSAFQRLSGTAARSIFSIAPPSGGSHVDGRMIRIYNVGTFNLTLKHNYTTGTTQANRMFCVQSADIVIATNDFAELIYDGTNNGSGAAGWRVA